MIRPAAVEDAPGIAAVQVRTWHTAYRGIVPDAYLATVVLDEAKIARSRGWLEGPAAVPTFVAVEQGGIVGFASCGPQRDAELPYAGELYAIYVLATHQKAGLGRALVRAVTGELRGRGLTSMSVWVLERGPGCAFYERLGGRLLEKRLEREFAGVTLGEVAYGWADTGGLA